MIEVVMRKKMSVDDYHDMRKQAEKKGWKVDAFQIGYYSEGYKNKLEK